MSESQKAEPQGRPVRFSDDELVEMVHTAVLGDGIRSAGAAEKAFRAAGKGSNGKRIRRRGRWPSGTCPMSRTCSRSTPPR